MITSALYKSLRKTARAHAPSMCSTPNRGNPPSYSRACHDQPPRQTSLEGNWSGVTDICDIDHTYESTVGSRSILDHFIVSQNCANHVILYEVAHDCNNLSDHNAVCICLSFDVVHNDVTDDKFRPHSLWK